MSSKIQKADQELADKSEIAARMAFKPEEQSAQLGEEVSSQGPVIGHGNSVLYPKEDAVEKHPDGGYQFSGQNNPQVDLDKVVASDLPPEVRAQLNSADTLEMEELIIGVIRAAGGRANVDKIIVGLWTIHRKQIERTKLIRRLRSMAEDNKLVAHDRPRGTYSLN